MSQLNVDSIKDRTGANQPDIVGAAKAFVNFDGTGTVAIRNGFNVSSITDNGIGNYNVNFTDAMPDASYSTVVSLNNRDLSYMHFATSMAVTSSYVKITTAQSNLVSGVDYNHVSVAIFR